MMLRDLNGVSGEGAAFEAREFVELGRGALRAAAYVGDAGARIEEHALATAVGGTVGAGAVGLRPFPIRVAGVSGVSHCPFSFFRGAAGCRCNRVCLSGEERDGEGGAKSMAWRGQAALARPTPHKGAGCRAWRTTRGCRFCFGNERAAALGVPPVLRASGGGPWRMIAWRPRFSAPSGVPRGTPHARIVTRMGRDAGAGARSAWHPPIEPCPAGSRPLG